MLLTRYIITICGQLLRLSRQSLRYNIAARNSGALDASLLPRFAFGLIKQEDHDRSTCKRRQMRRYAIPRSAFVAMRSAGLIRRAAVRMLWLPSALSIGCVARCFLAAGVV